MRRILHGVVYKGEKYYIGECIDLPVVTQGKSIDEAVKNLREAISLHLEGEDLQSLDISENPSILVNLELEPIYGIRQNNKTKNNKISDVTL